METKEEIQLEVNNKTSNFGSKAHIKKGYRPGKLVNVSLYKDGEGNPILGKFGHQLILDFEVYETNDKDEPTKIMTYECDIEGKKVTKDVILSKFVYHMYCDQKTKKLSTAVTMNSAITKIFEALGWVFDASKPLRVNDFIGRWAELNVDDYETKEGKKASTIKDIKKWDGNVPTLQPVTPAKKESTLTPEERQKLEENKKTLKDQLDKGLLTEKGYSMAIEQINIMLNR